MERHTVEKYLQYSESYAVKELATALLAEMDKPKDDVWKDVPDYISVVFTQYSDEKIGKPVYKRYERTIPKSPEREIAEKKAKEWRASTPTGNDPIADMIESAINEAMEKLK